MVSAAPGGNPLEHSKLITKRVLFSKAVGEHAWGHCGKHRPPSACISPPTTMTEKVHSEPEAQPLDTGTSLYTGAFFPCSERLRISGGVFTSNITNITEGTPPLPPDFRMIPIGDIYLRHGVGVVTRSTGTNCARRLYSARIEGRKTEMTVTMYQGENAEEEWREDLSRYLWLRHPNFLQVYGAASSAGIHAIILHDELIPWANFECLIKHSPSLMVHLFVRVKAEAKDVEDYFDLVFHKELWGLVHTLWIDRSNGRLCIDLISDRLQWNSPPSSQSLRPTAPGIDTDMLLNEYHMLFPPLTPEQYHFITWFHCSNTFSPYQDGPLPPIHVASILWSSEGSEALHVEDANNPVIIPTNPVIMFWPWTMRGKAMANGWERQAVIADTTVFTNSCIFLSYESNKFADMSISINFDGPESWLSQANHIFDQLNVASKKETYALVESVTFELFVTRPGFDRRSGYLFVCPPDDFRLPGSSSFRWPDCPAYWSIDPTGAERLTTEAARLLGFPILEFRTRVKLSSLRKDTGRGYTRGFVPAGEGGYGYGS
ncbi:hypothetical protein B0H11DRAFT_2283857 [Mycena galericulata]|nr:hypothetical protein B0H11DRAFT_2283857 [Mycena galericulata]